MLNYEIDMFKLSYCLCSENKGANKNSKLRSWSVFCFATVFARHTYIQREKKKKERNGGIEISELARMIMALIRSCACKKHVSNEFWCDLCTTWRHTEWRKKERKGRIERKNLSIFWELPMLTLICYLPVITRVSYANIATTTATKNYTMPITHLNDL